VLHLELTAQKKCNETDPREMLPSFKKDFMRKMLRNMRRTKY